MIKLDERGPYRYEIDLDFCKSCGLCAAECPPTVIEARIELQPVVADPFVVDVDQPATDRVTAFLVQATTAPRRRIYD